MSSSRFSLLFAGLLVATLATGSRAAEIPHVRLNDPSGDPTGTNQTSPAYGSLGDVVLASWPQGGAFPPDPGIRTAYSTDAGTTFTQLGAPPAPTNWTWTSVPIVVSDPVHNTLWVCSQGQNLTLSAYGLLLVGGRFNGAAWVWDAPQLVRTTTALGQVALAASESDGRLYLAFRGETTLEFQYSADGAQTWSPPATIEADPSAGWLPQVHVANDGDVLLSYGWLSGGGAGAESTPALRVSEDGGQSFGARIALPAYIEGRGGPPGQKTSLNLTDNLRSIAIDRTSFEHAGRIYLCWAESFDYFADPLPPFGDPALPPVFESEPNDTPGTATGLPAACSLSGSTGVGDKDYFAISLQPGERLVMHPDPVSGQPFSYRIKIVGPDGTHSLTNWSVGGASPYHNIGFTAPSANLYYVLVEPSFTTMTTYNIRAKVLSSPSATGRARDRHDVFVSWSDDGSNWSIPTMASMREDQGLDDNLPSIAVGPDGRPYVTWDGYLNDPTGGAKGTPYLVRSSDGAATWSFPAAMTNSVVDWGAILTPDQGIHNPVQRDGNRVGFSWSDGRTGDMDVYFGEFETGLEKTCPSDIEAGPGQNLELGVTLASRNPVLSDNAYVSIVSERAWTISSEARQPWVAPRSDLEPATTPFTVSVPETAMAGTNTICLYFRPNPTASVRETCCFQITVNPLIGVEFVTRGEFGFRMIAPNPAASVMTCTFALSSIEPATLVAYDAVGHAVRVLLEGRLGPGIHTISWNGKDDRGRKVQPGIYYLKLEQAGRISTTRVVRVGS